METNIFHFNFIACSGLGNFRLLPQFSAAAREVDELCLITCYSPQEITEKLRMQSEQQNAAQISSTDVIPDDKELDDASLCSDSTPSSTPYARAR